MKNKTVDLVNAWASFEAAHPDAAIEDFCRFYLIAGKQEQRREMLFDGAIPPRPDIVLGKLIDRIAKIARIYADKAMKHLPITHFEEFALLNAIAQTRDLKKTEVIYHTLNELSTGLNLLAMLTRKGLISEADDPSDRRSKRLNLTKKGEKVLQACYERLSKVPEMLFHGMAPDDVELCIQLLKRVDLQFAASWMDSRQKDFDQVYQQSVSKDSASPGGHKKVTRQSDLRR